MGQRVVEAARNALNIRYSLLPYIYTLFVGAHLSGHPVARSVFYEFPKDRDTYDLSERQFMLGPSLMVVPVLEEVGKGLLNDSNYC